MSSANAALIDEACKAAQESGLKRPTAIRRAVQLIMDGATLREISRSADLSHNTVAKLRAVVYGNGFKSMCDCGRPVEHKGLCAARRSSVARFGQTVEIGTVANFLIRRDVAIKRLGNDTWMVDSRVLNAAGLVDKANRIRAEMRLAPFALRAG